MDSSRIVEQNTSNYELCTRTCNTMIVTCFCPNTALAGQTVEVYLLQIHHHLWCAQCPDIGRYGHVDGVVCCPRIPAHTLWSVQRPL